LKKAHAADNYNKIKTLAKTKYILYVHEDTAFAPDFINCIEESIKLDKNFGAMGVVGFDSGNNTVWSDATSMKEIDRVDACCLLINKENPIDFDSKTFDELHCYVEDYCMQAKYNHGLKCYTLPYASYAFENSDIMDFSRSYFMHHGYTYKLNNNIMWGNYDRYRNKLFEKWSTPKVYDCFMFFNELDILEIRLNELDSVVDYFVLVESIMTHQESLSRYILVKIKKDTASFYIK
jgi:hypothetical protein